MKKIITTLLALVLPLTLVSCGNKTSDATTFYSTSGEEIKYESKKVDFYNVEYVSEVLKKLFTGE